MQFRAVRGLYTLAQAAEYATLKPTGLNVTEEDLGSFASYSRLRTKLVRWQGTMQGCRGRMGGPRFVTMCWPLVGGRRRARRARRASCGPRCWRQPRPACPGRSPAGDLHHLHAHGRTLPFSLSLSFFQETNIISNLFDSLEVRRRPRGSALCSTGRPLARVCKLLPPPAQCSTPTRLPRGSNLHRLCPTLRRLCLQGGGSPQANILHNVMTIRQADLPGKLTSPHGAFFTLSPCLPAFRTLTNGAPHGPSAWEWSARRRP